MPYVGCDVTGHISGVASGGIGRASRFSSAKAEVAKTAKYAEIAIKHAFVPLAFES